MSCDDLECWPQPPRKDPCDHVINFPHPKSNVLMWKQMVRRTAIALNLLDLTHKISINFFEQRSGFNKTQATTPITTDHWARSISNLHRTKSFFNNRWVAMFLDLNICEIRLAFATSWCAKNNWIEQRILATASGNKIVVRDDAGWQSLCRCETCGANSSWILASVQMCFFCIAGPMCASEELKTGNTSNDHTFCHLEKNHMDLKQTIFFAMVMDSVNCTSGSPQCAVAFDVTRTAKIGEDTLGIFSKKGSTLWPESAVAHCSD